jgi:hypothetical protein
MAKLRKLETATFRNPSTREKLECKVKDQVWPIEPESFPKHARKKGYGWRQPAFVVQLLDWDGKKRVRFTYWIRNENAGPEDWRFGGQYSAIMTVGVYRAMLKKLNEKQW